MSHFIFIHPDDITILPERQRTSFDEKTQVELTDSIKRLGLIQPLVVEAKGDKWELVAGERRLRSMRAILTDLPDVKFIMGAPAGLIPAMERRDLSEEARFELELEENIQRQDLTFIEKAKALAKLHNMRSQRSGGQTLDQTASEARVQRVTVSDSLLVAKNLERIPELAKAESLKEAVKIIKQVDQKEHVAKLAKTFDLSKTEHKLLRGDAIELARKFEANSFDLICSDPPYGIGADSFGDQASTGHKYSDAKEYVWKELLPGITEEWGRVAKPDSFAYVFCADIENFDKLSLLMGLAGFYVWPRPLIWNKLGAGMVPVPDKGPRYTYECILYAWKGDRKVLRQAMPDVLSYQAPKRLLHAAQKPAALLADLLSRVAVPGDRVLDSFAGSGSIFLAGNTLRLQVTATENDEAAYNQALMRITERVENEPIDLAPDIEL